MQVTVSGAPFAVTFPNGGNTIPSGPIAVTWNVGGGSVAASVNILLSTNGGSTWTALATNAPNDGSQNVTCSTGLTRTTCRIKVESVGNIFYDVSNSDFTIVGDPAAVQTPEISGLLAITRIAPNPARGRLRIEYTNSRESHLRLRILDAQGRAIATLVNQVQNAGRHQATWNVEAARRVAPGLYFVRLDSEAESAVRTAVISR